MTGRRLPDTALDDLPEGEIQGGDYWRVIRPDGEPLDCGDDAHAGGNLTRGVWMICVPRGNGIGTLRKHTVREHEDGTISVRRDDGSSNSILKGDWHGYIEHGVWNEIG